MSEREMASGLQLDTRGQQTALLVRIVNGASAPLRPGDLCRLSEGEGRWMTGCSRAEPPEEEEEVLQVVLPQARADL